MLSAETSVGRYPIETVRVMREIADHTETFLAGEPLDSIPRIDPEQLEFASAVTHGTSVLACQLRVHLIGVWTETGTTVRLLSKRRIPQIIIGLSRISGCVSGWPCIMAYDRFGWASMNSSRK